MKLLRSIYDVILDRSPEEVLGAIAIAVAVSIALSGVFALFRRKVEDRVLLVIVLMIVACVASMGFGAGYVMTSKDRTSRPGTGEGFGPMGRQGPLTAQATRALKRADTDGDGRISSAEAAEAARSFVVALEPAGGNPVDFMTLATALAQNEFYFPFSTDHGGPPMELDGLAAGWLVDSADTDADRRLSMDEATAFLKKADADGDGLLSRRELRSVMRTPSPDPAPFGPPPTRRPFPGRPDPDGPSTSRMRNQGADAPAPPAGGPDRPAGQGPGPTPQPQPQDSTGP